MQIKDIKWKMYAYMHCTYNVITEVNNASMIKYRGIGTEWNKYLYNILDINAIKWNTKCIIIWLWAP